MNGLFEKKIIHINNMKIRKMQISDYKSVYDLWMPCKGMGLNDVDDSENGINRFLKRNPDTCFVAEVDDKIVGAILTGNDGRHGYIYHTSVHPSYQKQGIGSALVKNSLEELKKAGISKVALVVFKNNLAGNTFWEKQGFTVRSDLTYRNKSLVEMVRIDT